MSRPPPVSSAIGNQLLAGLPRKAYGRLLPSLKAVSLSLDDVIDAPGEPARYIMFPTTAVLSVLCVMKSGRWVETGMVGNEGMSGMAACLGTYGTTAATVVQVAGEAVRIPTRAFRKEFDRGAALHDLLLRYIGALVVQISQSVGCNTHHILEARLSRWLLIVRDRTASDELSLDHKFLSQMLGTGRSAVTIAAGSLRRAGLIRYTRGKITILDRQGLEASSCECYGVVRAAYESLRLP